jgi:three-Cys-motif partner protein
LPRLPDDDGLPISEVGEWTLEKHDRLRRYADISRGVRAQFIGRAGATYIDLFCGPGRSLIRETGQLIDGSPIVAATKALEGGAPFTKVLIADIEQSNVDAASKRLVANGVAAQTFTGPADKTVSQIVLPLDPYGLHFAFLDPFNLGDLPFNVIEELAKLNRMDVLIHVSAQDFQRNLRRNIDQEGGALDRFAPRWREHVDVGARGEVVGAGILAHWLRLIRGLDMQPSKGIELVSGGKNQRLYWLVFVARHRRAADFWDKIRNVTLQGRLGV